jgi:STE24 endopeptidase
MKKLILICIIILSGTGYIATAQTDSLAAQTSFTRHFDADSATKAYLSVLSPDQKEKSDSYFEGGYWISLWQFIIEVFIAFIFLYLGLSKQVIKIAATVKNKNLSNLVYILLYLFFAFLIAFPYAIYTDYFREHSYGLSNMTFPQWLKEEMISLALTLVFGSLVIMLLFIVMRKIKERWWIWGSGLVIIFVIFSLFISPVFIAPLFNKYTPLEDGPVRQEILSLARANGIPVKNIYQFNASKQSTRISANVSGFGKTIRISLNDNLLNKCTLPEIKSVMAHEMGHYVLNHTYKLLLYFSILIIAGFAIINYIMKKAISRFGARWGIESISDIGSLPLFILLFSCYIFVLTPVFNNISRTTESEADIFGLNAAREPDGFASVSMKLSEYRKIDPGKLEEIIFYDHPSGKARVSMAMRWKAETVVLKDRE